MQTPASDEPMSRLRPMAAWAALIGLTLAHVCSYADRTLVAALGEPIKAAFHLSDSRLSLLTGVSFAMVYAMMGFPLARLADRGLHKAVLTASLAFWSLMAMSTVLATQFPHMVLARVGVAAGEAGLLPASMALITAYFSPRWRPLAFGIFSFGAVAGGVVGFSAGSALAAIHGWRSTFVIVGAPGLALALILVFWLPGAPAHHDDGRAGPRGRWRADLLEILRTPALNWVLIASAAHNFVVFAGVNWLSMYLMRSHGMSLQHAGMSYGAVYGGGMLCGLLLGGWISGALAARSLASSLLVASIAAGLALPALLLALWYPSAPVALAGIGLGSALGAACLPPTMSAVQGLVRPMLRATSASLYLIINALFGAGLGTLVTGVLSDVFAKSAGLDSLRLALTFSSMVYLIAALGFALARRRLRIVEATGASVVHARTAVDEAAARA